MTGIGTIALRCRGGCHRASNERHPFSAYGSKSLSRASRQVLVVMENLSTHKVGARSDRRRARNTTLPAAVFAGLQSQRAFAALKELLRKAAERFLDFLWTSESPRVRRQCRRGADPGTGRAWHIHVYPRAWVAYLETAIPVVFRAVECKAETAQGREADDYVHLLHRRPRRHAFSPAEDLGVSTQDGGRGDVG
jgi:hypothetical protein